MKEALVLSGRIPVLDGLRGVAILLVVLLHACQKMSVKNSFESNFQVLVHSGWVGVDLFFVLSGFLITRILWKAKCGGSYFLPFYFRRFLRIIPLYILFLLVFLYLLPLVLYDVNDRGPENHIWYWLHLTNVYSALQNWPSRALAHLWTLALEEQYYLLWPMVLFLLKRSWAMSTCLVLVLLSVGMRFISYDIDNLNYIYTFPLCRLDGLALGSFLALYIESKAIYPIRFKGWGLVFVLVVVPILLLFFILPDSLRWWEWGRYQQTLNYTFISAYFAFIILVFLYLNDNSYVKRIMSSSFMVFLGKYSYSVYLFHLPIDEIIRRSGLHPQFISGGQYGLLIWLLYFCLLLLFSYGFAIVTWNLVESKLLSIKEKFSYK